MALTVHSINSEAQWNVLANSTSSVAPLTANDIVRIDTSFTFTSQPVVLYLGAGLLNGKTNTITFDNTILPSTIILNGIVHINGGTVRTLKLLVSSVNTCNSVVLLSSSTGTIRNCEVDGGNVAIAGDGGVIIRLIDAPITIRRVKVSNIRLAFSSGIAHEIQGASVVIEKCSVTFSCISNQVTSAYVGRVRGSTVTISESTAVCTNISNSNSIFFTRFVESAPSTAAVILNKCHFVNGDAWRQKSTGTLLTGNYTDCILTSTRAYSPTYGITNTPSLSGFHYLSSAGQNLTITSQNVCALQNSFKTSNVNFTTTAPLTGSFGDAGTYPGAGTVAGYGLSTDTYVDATDSFPLLRAIADPTEFTGYTTAVATTVTRVSISLEADAAEPEPEPEPEVPESGSVICFARNTLLKRSDGRSSIPIHKVTPGTDLQSPTNPSGRIHVKRLHSCRTHTVVEFPPLTLSPNQHKSLVTSPYHLIHNTFSGKWAEAKFMEGGLSLRLPFSLRLFNVEADEGWSTMIAEGVRCETLAVTAKDKKRRHHNVTKYNIKHTS